MTVTAKGRASTHRSTELHVMSVPVVAGVEHWTDMKALLDGSVRRSQK